jgi:hypothetical protein
MSGRSLAVAALVGLMAAACAEAAPAAKVPLLDRARAEQVAMQADDLVRAAMAGSAAALASIFRDEALVTLTAQAERLAQRRMRVEQRAVARSVVHFDAPGLEVVLAVKAHTRVVTPDALDPPWTPTTRQWWLRLAFAAGRWWVVYERDLTPDQWFGAR